MPRSEIEIFFPCCRFQDSKTTPGPARARSWAGTALIMDQFRGVGGSFFASFFRKIYGAPVGANPLLWLHILPLAAQQQDLESAFDAEKPLQNIWHKH